MPENESAECWPIAPRSYSRLFLFHAQLCLARGSLKSHFVFPWPSLCLEVYIPEAQFAQENGLGQRSKEDLELGLSCLAGISGWPSWQGCALGMRRPLGHWLLSLLVGEAGGRPQQSPVKHKVQEKGYYCPCIRVSLPLSNYVDKTIAKNMMKRYFEAKNKVLIYVEESVKAWWLFCLKAPHHWHLPLPYLLLHHHPTPTSLCLGLYPLIDKPVHAHPVLLEDMLNCKETQASLPGAASQRHLGRMPVSLGLDCLSAFTKEAANADSAAAALSRLYFFQLVD